MARLIGWECEKPLYYNMSKTQLRDGDALRTIHFNSATQALSWVTLHLVNG